MYIIKNKYLLTLVLCILTFVVKAQTTPEQVVENYVNLLNEWQRSPDNTEKRKKVLASLQTEGDGCGMKDEIVQNYNTGTKHCLPNEYLTIFYDEGHRNHIKVEIVGNLKKNSDDDITIVTAVLSYSGGISLTTVSDFWIVGGKISGIVSNELEITKIRKKGGNITKRVDNIQPKDPEKEIVSTKTDNKPTNSSNHSYVDLGLPSGTLWATCNVGANNPWEYGDYFAWGETKPKTEYSWANYKFANGDLYSLKKYCNMSIFGNNVFSDSLTILEQSDDVGYSQWNSDWCMPTITQWLELENECIWKWTKHNGKSGYSITGRNDNTIFLPAERYNRFGNYWSSSLNTDNPNKAWSLNFDSTKQNIGDNYRYLGQAVRAVMVRRSKTFLKEANRSLLRGCIYDKKRHPLPGVDIVEKGTKNGTITDLDGKFELRSIQASPVIVVSCPGYKTKEVTYNYEPIILIKKWWKWKKH